MTVDPGPDNTAPEDTAPDHTAPGDTAASATPEEIEADIAATRARLAEAVDALVAKTDVKAQARAAAEDVRARGGDVKDAAAGQAQQARRAFDRLAAPAKAAVVVAPLLLVVWVIIRTVRSRRS